MFPCPFSPLSCCQPPDLSDKEFDHAADKYFVTVLKLRRRPTILETIEHYVNAGSAL